MPGAAQHYVDHANSVRDFDVWSFYAERADGPFPARWRGTADFGRSRFGHTGLPSWLAVIVEIGLDMGTFATPGHLVSWARLSPQTIQSGPKNRSGHAGKGNPYLRAALVEAAATVGMTRHRPRRALPADCPAPGWSCSSRVSA